MIETEIKNEFRTHPDVAAQVFHVEDLRQYQRAGPTDLIQLLPAQGVNSIFIQKWVLETFFCAIIGHEFTHFSGPTGSAKTSVLEALYLVPENFAALCRGMDVETKPLALFPVEMVVFDTPGELIQRRAIHNGTTLDEESCLVQALRNAAQAKESHYPVIWLREMGRVHSASIQGGLLDLMTKSQILLPSGDRIEGDGIAWIADSNYQAEDDSVHTLVTFDDALKRRFTVNLTLDYPTASQEVLILECLSREGQIPPFEEELLTRVVNLGKVIRQQRAEGNLQSVPPPTIYGYMAFLRMAHALPHLSSQQIAAATLLGNATQEDRKLSSAVINEVFGLQAESDDEDPAAVGNLF